MENQQTLQGRWNEIQGKVRQKWGQLTDDDMQNVKGNVDQLVGLIQRKTGEARRNIESYIDELTADGSNAANRAMESARQYGNQAAEAVRHGYDNVAHEVRDRFSQAEKMIHDRPGASAAIALGAGVCLGIVLGLCLRGR